MALKSGTRLGPYEIVGPLGAGGMGEVYRARDTRLDRTVAVKVLPEHLSADPERRQRFEREARAISSLNHPHICTLHDIGRAGDVDFLVMEYLEGETLSERLNKGPLPVEEALRYGVQMADALDKAHRSGIVHRDLKPGNIMLTRAGAKLLDFGLAKAGPPARSGAVLTAPPTENLTLTGAGTVLGTFQYMAPEQLEGHEANPRTDIFAFGMVLYEMLTGRKAFEGKTQASLIGAILKDTPAPLSSLAPLAPRALDHVVQRCLAKDPEARWQSAADLAHELEWIAAEVGRPEAAPAAAPAAATPPARPFIAWTLALIAIAAALALGLWSATRPTPGARIARLSIHLPAGETLAASWWWSPSLALSPDGTSVVWVASRAGASRLYVRALDQYEARALPGTEGVESVFFSPDGQWVGFITEDQLLKKVSLSGGAPQTLGNAQSAKGACWGGGDTIYFAPGAPLGIHRISTSGGRAEPVTALDPKREEIAHAWPELLPGGKALLFTVRTAKQPSFDEAEIAALSLGTGQRKTLVQGGTSPHYLPTGHLLFVRAGTLMAAPFDPARLELTGPAVPALENVRENPRVGAAQLAVARDGTLAYIPGGISFGNQTLVRVDRKGAGEPLSALKRPFEDFTLSPDGRFIATTVEGGVTDVWLLDIARDSLARFTFGVENRDPVWTPDGKRLVFAAYRDGKWGLFAKPVEGSGLEERLTSSDYPGSPLCYTPDGKVLIYGQTDPQTRDDIWILPLAEGKPRPLIKTPFAEEWAMISPDGRWLAYTSDESGRPEVYAQPFPGPGGKWKISSEGGIRPAWRHDGRELYYRNGGALLAVPVDTRAGFAAGKPEKLFEGHYLSSFHDYAPTRDGRFILMREAEQDATELRVVLGWRDELQARIPGAKR